MRAGGAREAGERGAVPQGPGSRVQVQVSVRREKLQTGVFAGPSGVSEREANAIALVGPKIGAQGGEQGRAHQYQAGFLYWGPTAAPQMLAMDWESSSTTKFP